MHYLMRQMERRDAESAVVAILYFAMLNIKIRKLEMHDREYG